MRTESETRRRFSAACCPSSTRHYRQLLRLQKNTYRYVWHTEKFCKNTSVNQQEKSVLYSIRILMPAYIAVTTIPIDTVVHQKTHGHIASQVIKLLLISTVGFFFPKQKHSTFSCIVRTSVVCFDCYKNRGQCTQLLLLVGRECYVMLSAYFSAWRIFWKLIVIALCRSQFQTFF